MIRGLLNLGKKPNFSSMKGLGSRTPRRGSAPAANAIPMGPGPRVTNRTRNASNRRGTHRRKNPDLRPMGVDDRLRAQRAQRARQGQARAARPARHAKIKQIRRASATGRPQPGMNPARTPHALGGNGRNTARKMTDFKKGLAFGALGGAVGGAAFSDRSGRPVDKTRYSDSRGIYGF